MNLFKRILLSSLFCCLSFLSLSIYAQSQGCINITTGNCNAVGGIANFSTTQLNWTLTDAMNSNAIEYDYRTANCAVVPTVSYSNPDTNGGFTFGVIDTTTAVIWQSNNPACLVNSADSRLQYGQFGNIHCTFSNQYLNGFDFTIVGTHPTDNNNATYSGMPWPQVISQFLDSIPNGYLVFMYAVSKPPYAALWAQDSNLVNKMAAMGATNLPLLCDTTNPGHLPSAPYIFWTVKGNPSWGGQAVGNNYDSTLTALFCYSSSTTQVTEINPTTDFHIYPNPVNLGNEFTISTSQTGSIIFYDALGRIIDERKLSNGINAVKLASDDELVFYKASLQDGHIENGKLVFIQ